MDFIYETAHDLLEDRSDYQIVIEHLEKAAGKSHYSGYKRKLIAALYEEIGDDEASLRALEKDLKYVTGNSIVGKELAEIRLP